MVDKPDMSKSAIDVRIDHVENDVREIWSVLNAIKERLQNRLPIWATFAISFLTMLIGILTTALVTAVRLAASHG